MLRRYALWATGMQSLTGDHVVVAFAERCRYAVRSDWHLSPIKAVSEVAYDVASGYCTSYDALFMFVGQLL